MPNTPKQYKFASSQTLQYLWQNKIKPLIDTKSDNNHTHDRVNGYKIEVSTTVPTSTDTTIITFVK